MLIEVFIDTVWNVHRSRRGLVRKSLFFVENLVLCIDADWSVQRSRRGFRGKYFFDNLTLRIDTGPLTSSQGAEKGESAEGKQHPHQWRHFQESSGEQVDLIYTALLHLELFKDYRKGNIT